MEVVIKRVLVKGKFIGKNSLTIKRAVNIKKDLKNDRLLRNWIYNLER